MNIDLNRNIVLFHGCRWSRSDGQAPEQKEMRDKQDWALLGRGGLAATHVFTVVGEEEDEGDSWLLLTLRGGMGTEDCVMGDNHIAV